jgi:hypothetical protein
VSAHPDCPHCTCRWVDDIPVTIINPDAPGYPLVLLVDAMTGQLAALGAGRRNARRRAS